MNLDAAVASLNDSLARGDELMQSKSWSGGFKSEAIREVLCALSSAPTPQAVTVDDAAVERALDAYDQINHGRDEEAMRAALLAAFPQRREE